MDGFKEAVTKLEQLRDGGFIALDEFDRRKKELVDKYVGTSGAPTSGAVTAPAGYALAGLCSTVAGVKWQPF